MKKATYKTARQLMLMISMVGLCAVSNMALANDKTIYVTDAVSGEVVKINVASADVKILDRASDEVKELKRAHMTQKVPSSLQHYMDNIGDY